MLLNLFVALFKCMTEAGGQGAIIEGDTGQDNDKEPLNPLTI